jgi:hypothetical protein
MPFDVKFRWFPLPETKSASVSLNMVSIPQFEQFLKTSDYIPTHDRMTYTSLLAHVLLNFGDKPSTPILGVSHDDATAFCEWANVRLPTENELSEFFDASASAGHRFNWGGLCWTSTVEDGRYVLCERAHSGEIIREVFSADWYDYPFPSFRVARTNP